MRNKNAPLVSINVVAYQQEAYLAETLDSILAQTYPHLEILICDDASKDKTPDIARAYAKKDKRIKLHLNAQNKGPAGNYNVGLQAATGQYFCPFAGDDLMLPTKIEKQVQALENNPAATLCYHDLDWFESDTKETLTYQSQRVKPETNAKNLALNNYIGGPAVMCRLDDLPKTGQPEDIWFVGDWYIWLYLASRGEILYVDEPLVRYRRHGENLSALHDGQDHREQLLAFAQKNNAFSPEILEWLSAGIVCSKLAGQLKQKNWGKAALAGKDLLLHGPKAWHALGHKICTNRQKDKTKAGVYGE